MTNLYTPEMAREFHSMDKPFPFTVDVVQHSHSLSLRVYEDEVKKFQSKQYDDATDYINAVKHMLESHGAIVFIEGVAGGPPRRR